MNIYIKLTFLQQIIINKIENNNPEIKVPAINKILNYFVRIKGTISLINNENVTFYSEMFFIKIITLKGILLSLKMASYKLN